MHTGRHAYAAAMLLALGAAHAAVSCAPTPSCDTGACSTGTTLTARVAIPRGVLDAAALEVCRNALCATRGDATERGFSLQGALAGHGSIDALDDETSRLTLVLEDAPGAQKDGDRYVVRVRDARTGETLYAVERGVLKYERTPVEDECPARCSRAEIRLYPDSASGLTCTATACDAGVHLTGTSRVARHDMEGATLRACRNDSCGGLTVTGPLPLAPDSAYFVLKGAVDATLLLTVDANDVFGVTIGVTGDPADLRDGDRYDVVLTNASGGRILGFTQTVSYAASFPNGAECDVVPCRTAEGALVE